VLRHHECSQAAAAIPSKDRYVCHGVGAPRSCAVCPCRCGCRRVCSDEQLTIVETSVDYRRQPSNFRSARREPLYRWLIRVIDAETKVGVIAKKSIAERIRQTTYCPPRAVRISAPHSAGANDQLRLISRIQYEGGV